jgi:hypothetical protein
MLRLGTVRLSTTVALEVVDVPAVSRRRAG